MEGVPQAAGETKKVGAIDSIRDSTENMYMETIDLKPASESHQDLTMVINHLLSGKPMDPDLIRRVRERSEQATEELRRKVGTLNVAVDLIREIRDEA